VWHATGARTHTTHTSLPRARTWLAVTDRVAWNKSRKCVSPVRRVSFRLILLSSYYDIKKKRSWEVDVRVRARVCVCVSHLQSFKNTHRPEVTAASVRCMYSAIAWSCRYAHRLHANWTCARASSWSFFLLAILSYSRSVPVACGIRIREFKERARRPLSFLARLALRRRHQVVVLRCSRQDKKIIRSRLPFTWRDQVIRLLFRKHVVTISELHYEIKRELFDNFCPFPMLADDILTSKLTNDYSCRGKLTNVIISINIYLYISLYIFYIIL